MDPAAKARGRALVSLSNEGPRFLGENLYANISTNSLASVKFRLAWGELEFGQL